MKFFNSLIFSCTHKASTQVQISLYYLEHLLSSKTQKSRNECFLCPVEKQGEKTPVNLYMPSVPHYVHTNFSNLATLHHLM